ncbi:uncharacterized protein HMPREF1541_04600 [Cyphellophora europaea CBS 101466]|uniref:FCP1 homology domain-containing protein n=1 Tax=Cyphellophora europaea (strain CBS 101466) TaxID=1220924 RepID=W2RX93_CYPE1|nr:uncharacterized protein HMPREF1541_04600 [Cyphellophora europaea CBS 101466]ETN40324.1 hypothetical protein HMPREF1541_04600 [Cyphellophora europaea CBS 101466]
MNSLNLLSSRVIGQSPATTRPRSKSQGEILKKEEREELRGRSYSDEKVPLLSKDTALSSGSDDTEGNESPIKDQHDEKKPFLDVAHQLEPVAKSSAWRSFVKRITDALTAILSAIGAPVVWLANCFKDEDGRYTVLSRRKTRSRNRHAAEKPTSKALHETQLRHSYSSESMTSAGSTESDSDHPMQRSSDSRSSEPRRSSIRIKEQNDPALKKRKQKRNSPLGESTPLTVDNIKSPTSPIPSLKVTRYPHAPQPPRPLVPRRQPSYSNIVPRSPSRHLSSSQEQKTLVLDLDETLIHSLAKGGRMSSGHMVEVKLNAPVAVSTAHANQPAQVIGPQHPILYYVHKRPHCDEFLKKVCKWYKLVIFTASVQEYADPVIDWLEQERKYFVGRYYRQHCTFRNGAYIKDLSSIEPDLSKVIILDNSPVSYIFHEDNAIPIEGWINDPTDNDLLHLIPMLEALQYVTDVRALLALRRGEAEAAA